MSPDSSPNFLLVTTDSLRADAVYDEGVDTPTHDTLAMNGHSYHRAFAQGPFTTFSMPSLFTSRYPSGLKYLEFSDSTVGAYIDNEPTIPEILQELGYETAGFHSNPLLSNLFGFDRGFQTFDARLPFSNTGVLPGRTKILADKLFRLVRKHAYLPAEKLTKRAVDWLDTRTDDTPFFLWLHYMDVHGPYQAKSGSAYLSKYRGERLWRKAQKNPGELTELEQTELRQLYRTEVEYTDKWIGVLMEELKERGLFDQTVTILTADHGELFGKRGQYSHPHLLYDELTRVPLIVHDSDRQSRKVDSIVELSDIAPTLVTLAGGTIPNSFVGDPLLNGTQQRARAISEADLVPEYHASVRTSDYRYIRNSIEDSEELYYHPNDPTESDNVAESHPEKLVELRESLNAHLGVSGRAAGTGRDVTHEEIDNSEVANRLRDLGYLE
jgi:arylsulfatase